jgi:phospholipase C
MLIVSPWTTGGWVCSQVFDHTSVLQFLETRFEIPEPNISAWRRAVCGDLTSAFDFSGASAPSALHFEVPKPIASLHRPYRVPAEQSMAEQEPGTRKARALPYELSVHCREETVAGKVWIDFANSGKAGAALYVYNGAKPDSNPRRYTVSAADTLSDYWLISESYDLTVHGPNGYFRQFRGNTKEDAHSKPEVQLRYDAAEGDVVLSLSNSGLAACTMQAIDGYNGNVQRSYPVQPGANVEDRWLLTTSAGWYDISISSMESPAYLRRFAGHVETGRPSLSDPALLGG